MTNNRFAEWLEKRYTKRLEQHYYPMKVGSRGGIKDGSHVTVIGGGISGSTFVRQLAMQAYKEGRNIRITLVNSTNCNYCGGLITDVALDALEKLCQMDVPDNLVLKTIEDCVYINKRGSVKVHLKKPLTATLRTSRFGIPGFDDSIKERITDGLPPEARENIEIIEPTLAKKVLKEENGEHNWRVVLSKRNPDNTNRVVHTDVIVIACGFRALNKPMLKDFQKLTGYEPPPTIPASVTEVDTSKATKNNIENKMFIIDGIISDCVVAFIPKGPHWLTLTTLNRELSIEKLNELFNHPRVREYIELSDSAQHLRCHTICSAQVYVREAKNFYGDNWLVIGDLTGYGRILKDGYFAAFLGGKLAAETLIYLGADKGSLERGYHKRLKHFPRDNFFGRNLFIINNWLNKKDWFSRYFISAAATEGKNKNGSYIHSAIRALGTGELSYRLITLLFILGLIRYPLTAISDFIKPGKREK